MNVYALRAERAMKVHSVASRVRSLHLFIMSVRCSLVLSCNAVYVHCSHCLHSYTQAFRRHIQAPTGSSEGAAARDALYNGVLSLSILLKAPTNLVYIRSCGGIQGAILPYFTLANSSIKAAFATPSVRLVAPAESVLCQQL